MSSFVKNKLKGARDALGKKEYEAARGAASQVLEYEPENYNACVKLKFSLIGGVRQKSCSNVFLGLALLELGQHEKSEQVIL